MDRRDFIGGCTGFGGFLLTANSALAMGKPAPKPVKSLTSVPSYAENYSELYKNDPRLGTVKWFHEAKFGLFMHYGLYSQLGRGEWVQYREQIPVAEYKKLKDTFTAEKFDADFITELACEAGMKYINITSKHHDGFCLFGTGTTDYNSVNSPARRDLVGELSDACHEKKLGLFLYYSLAADWQHPYFYPRKFNDRVQPDYPEPQPGYKWQKDEDFQIYMEYAETHVRELLTNYGHIAGIWFDPFIGYFGRPDLFPINRTYGMIKQLSPGTLISFKQGVTGTEDFAAPERKGHSMAEMIRKLYGPTPGHIAEMAWSVNQHKYNEVCDTLQPRMWGYVEESEHKGPDEVMEMLGSAAKQNSNLLLNTGPLPDGSIHPQDVVTLREVGRRIKTEGVPA